MRRSTPWELDTYDSVLGVVSIEVDTADEHGSVRRRGRDNDLLRTTLQVGRGPIEGHVRYKSSTEGAICALFGSGEDTSGLDDVLSTNGGPVDVGGVLLLEDRDSLALNPELAILGLDATLEAAVDGIVLEHVDHVLKVDEGARKGQVCG